MPVPHPFPPNNMDRLTTILIELPRLEQEASHIDQAVLNTEARLRYADLCEHLAEARRAVADAINALGGPLGVQQPAAKQAPKQQAKAQG